jgi:hypothetical protein
MINDVKWEKPNIKVMTIEEKWDQLHDFFTMDHMVSYYTHKRLGTVVPWVEDQVQAIRRLVPTFLGPLAKMMTKLAPRISLKQALNQVLQMDQMMHYPGEFEVAELPGGEICTRFMNCNRFKKQTQMVKQLDLNIDPREICDVEKMIITHPHHPSRDMGILVTDIVWEESGCVWTFKTEQ